jgi:hypothetical protein
VGNATPSRSLVTSDTVCREECAEGSKFAAQIHRDLTRRHQNMGSTLTAEPKSPFMVRMGSIGSLWTRVQGSESVDVPLRAQPPEAQMRRFEARR